MINFNSFPNNVDFICDTKGCYSLGTALAISDDSSNWMCYPWDNRETALGFPKLEDSGSWIPEAYRTFRYMILLLVPFVGKYMNGKKFIEEYSKFSEKYFPKKKENETAMTKELPFIEEISTENHLVSPTKSLTSEWEPYEGSEALLEKLRSISNKSLVVGQDMGNLTFASLTLFNSVLPINQVTTLLQTKKIVSSFNKIKKLHSQKNKKLEFSENALKFSGSTMKMVFKYTINSLPGKILVESFSTASSTLGSITSYRKKVDINFMLGIILLLGAGFKLEDLILQQLYSEEEAA